MLHCEAKCSENCPRLTGIPPHTALLAEITSLRESIERSEVEIGKVIRNELNERHVGGEVFAANAILQDIRDVHRRMIETLKESPSSSGMTETVHLQPNRAVQPQRVQEGMMVEGGARGEERHTMFFWDGKFHNIPLGFVFPTMNLHTLIVYWFVGSQQPFVPPLRYIKGYDFPGKQMAKMRVQVSMMRKLIQGVLRAANKVGFQTGTSGRNIKTLQQATALFEKAKPYFQFRSETHERRNSALLWRTVYDIYAKRNYKFVGEQ